MSPGPELVVAGRCDGWADDVLWPAKFLLRLSLPRGWLANSLLHFCPLPDWPVLGAAVWEIGIGENRLGRCAQRPSGRYLDRRHAVAHAIVAWAVLNAVFAF